VNQKENPVTATTNPRRLARTVGVLYLMLFIIGPIAFLVGKADLVVDGDAAATAANIVESESLFRLGMTAEAAVFIIEIVAASMLYVLFRPVSRHWSMAAMLGRFGQAVIQGVNLLWSALALSLIGGAGYLTAFDTGQLEALTQLFMDANGFMIHTWGLFFGVHLAILGWLVHRSGFLPMWLGWLLGLASIGYLAEGFGAIAAPGSGDFLAALVLVLAIPGELAFTGWLLFKGVDGDGWQRRAAVAV
jgi:hypothetical protein